MGERPLGAVLSGGLPAAGLVNSAVRGTTARNPSMIRVEETTVGGSAVVDLHRQILKSQSWSNFLRFHAVSRKAWLNNR